MITHLLKRLPSGEYSCSCGAVWDYDDGCDCPNLTATKPPQITRETVLEQVKELQV